MRYKMNIKKVLAMLMSLTVILSGGIQAYAEEPAFTDVKIVYTAPTQVNTKVCAGDTVSGSYIYNTDGTEQDTQYRWLYSDTKDFTGYTVLTEGNTTASTAGEDTKITINKKQAGKYLMFEVTAKDGTVSGKSEPMYIISQNIPVADYALITSDSKDANASTTAASMLSVRNNSVSTRVFLLKFNLEGYEEVKSAVLSMTIKDVYEKRTILAFPAGSDWSIKSTWNNLDWSQIGGSQKGDVSGLSEANELARLTELTANTNGKEMDITDYINSELKKGSTSISVAFFALKNDAGIAIRPPHRPNDAPYLQVSADAPTVSASEVRITDADGNTAKESLEGVKLFGDYIYDGENEEGKSSYRWMYAKDINASTWFTYKTGTTQMSTARTDTEITVDKLLCGNYVKLEISPISAEGETGKSVMSEAVNVMSTRLEALAAASIKENDKDSSVGISANSFHARKDAEGNRRATLLRYSLEGLSYPIEAAEFRYYMYYSSAAGEHALYDIAGGWEDGVTLTQYGPITSVWEGKEIGRVRHSGTASKDINPPEKLSADFTDYINNALKEGKKEINFAIWYPETSSTVVSFLRGPAHSVYPAQVIITEKTTNISRTLEFVNDGAVIEKLEKGNIGISAVADKYNDLTMVAVLFDSDGNMTDVCADSGADGFYAELDNSSGDGAYAEVYFWNGFSKLMEQTYICRLTPDGIFEE